MFNVYDLSNALPVAIFGGFALWAAVSRRHWFLRTAIVGSAILTTLFIPAYEVVLLLTVQTVVVVAGIAIWRRRRLRVLAKATGAPFRVSMETLLLAVVIVSVVTAVVARAPLIPLREWYQTSLSGFASGVTVLICVWLMFGRVRWKLRLLAVPPIILTLSFTLTCLRWAGHLTRFWYSMPDRAITEYLQVAMRDIGPATLAWAKPVGLGMAILCLWMFLMHRAGWFDPFGEKLGAPLPLDIPRKRVVVARIGLIALCCLAFIFPLVLFYRLLTPTPMPHIKLPVPNGFDDFVAAGRMIGPAAAAKLGAWNQLNERQLQSELDKHAAAFDRMSEGFQKKSRHPYVFKPWVQEDALALRNLLDALRGRSAHARRSGDVNMELHSYMDLLRLANTESRGMDTYYYIGILGQFEADVHAALWNLRTKLSATQCKQVAAQLCDLDRHREPWRVRVKRQKIIEENMGWQQHLMSILAEWSGNERHPWARLEHFRHLAESRILIVAFAIQAHKLETGRLPIDLSELTPYYLTEIPHDPFGKGEIKYRIIGDSYTLYSAGPDGTDNSGKRSFVKIGIENGDLTDVDLFGPPVTSQPGNRQRKS